jgi:hypothetical protein
MGLSTWGKLAGVVHPLSEGANPIRVWVSKLVVSEFGQLPFDLAGVEPSGGEVGLERR